LEFKCDVVADRIGDEEGDGEIADKEVEFIEEISDEDIFRDLDFLKVLLLFKKLKLGGEEEEFDSEEKLS